MRHVKHIHAPIAPICIPTILPGWFLLLARQANGKTLTLPGPSMPRRFWKSDTVGQGLEEGKRLHASAHW